LRTFLIDTDTASDDAIALVMALRHPEVRVAAITTVAGNVNVGQATRNALYTAEICGADIPVYAGAARPLLRAPREATRFHGADGMSDRNYPAPHRNPEAADAVEAIMAAIEANPGLVIVTLGPLTNLAMALARRPSLAANVARCVVMGGALCCLGNVTPAAEYNIWSDPEAARIVLHSELPVELIGWQLCLGEAAMNACDIEMILRSGSPLGRFAVECTGRPREVHRRRTGEDSVPLADPVAMAVALDPSVALEWGEDRVEIETASELTRGMTVVDRLGVAGEEQNRHAWGAVLGRPPATRVCWSIDIPRWKRILYNALTA
jgi:purine nucleosidase